ncbi:hypothetical protein [Bosea sp. 117]|uniref:alpha/beta hydrolase family esterase n=1 Tax=Bosea sp. 117 TaxID=1125973 RepID=UPI000691D417|nr:hypothetical protein [Bosea sp. 117]
MGGLALLLLLAVLIVLWVRRRRRLGKARPLFGPWRRLVPVTLDIGGVPRTALMGQRPAGSGPMPALLCFHGGLGDPAGFADRSGLAATALKHGFLPVFPAAPEGWRDGRPGRTDATRDIAFVAALIDRLAGDGLIDRRQVYAIGLSNGGMFVQRLAAERPDLLAGAAAVLASIPLAILDAVAAGPPLPFVLVCDHDDRIMPWHGGEVARGGGMGIGGRVAAVDDALAVWVERNRAEPVGEPRRIPGPSGWHADIHDYAPQAFSSEVGTGSREENATKQEAGAGGAPLRFVAMTGPGHRWPRWPAGRGAQAFDAGEAALEVFAGSSRAGTDTARAERASGTAPF